MLVSFVVFVNKEKNITNLTNDFMKRIDKSRYPAHRMEVLFIVLDSPNDGIRILKGSPIIKVVQIKDKSEGAALALCMEKCHGDIIIMAKFNSIFTKDRILWYGNSFKVDPKLAIMIEPDPGVMVLRKLKISFPGDLFDLKSYLILYALVNKYRIHGSWGRLHVKEVQRFYYKFDKITVMQKLHVLLKSGAMVI